jgi:hypothetical protein
MTEADVEIILQRALEAHPQAKPRIISDNGPQFVARDFKEFIRIAGLSHVRTSPYYPQSNGKIERWHRSLKSDCIRPGIPLSSQDARRLVGDFVAHYNTVRLHSAIGYITPAAKLSGNEKAIFAARDQKLLQARESAKSTANSYTPTLLIPPTLFPIDAEPVRGNEARRHGAKRAVASRRPLHWRGPTARLRREKPPRAPANLPQRLDWGRLSALFQERPIG